MLLRVSYSLLSSHQVTAKNNGYIWRCTIIICIRYFWQLPDDCSARSMKLWVAINVFDQIIQLCKSIYIYIYTDSVIDLSQWDTKILVVSFLWVLLLMDYSGESRLLMECREAIFVDKSAIDFLIFLLFFSKKFPIFPIFSIRSFLFSYFVEQPCHWTPWQNFFVYMPRVVNR